MATEGFPSPERVAQLHREARARLEEEFRRMTPLERMEEAYRLSTYMIDSSTVES